MEATKAVKVALNTLVDIACHSARGGLVPAPEIAKRLRISVSRIELLLRPLRESGLVIGVKGRTGGYQLSKDPHMITIKDIVLAINRIKKRKVEVSDMAKEFYQSLEAYMLSNIPQGGFSSAIKDCIPSFSEITRDPGRITHLYQEAPQKAQSEKRVKGEAQKGVQAPIKTSTDLPRGPNSVFSFAEYLNQINATN